MTNIYTGFRRVFMKPRALIITIIVAGAFLAFIALLPNRSLILSLPETYSIWDKTRIIFSLLGSLGTNFSTASLISYIFISILTGMNIALVYDQVRSRTKLHRTNGLGVIGVIVGVLGVGCTACGSVILSSLVGLTAASQFIGLLPLNGLEFTITSLVLIMGSTYYLLLQAGKKSFICKI